MMKISLKEPAPVVKKLVPFYIGFILGVLLVAVFGSTLLGSKGILGLQSLENIYYLEADHVKLLIYCIRRRLLPVLLILVFSVTAYGRLVISGYLCWYGMASGMLLTAAYARFGMKGILMLLGFAFPQYLIYIPAFLFLCMSVSEAARTATQKKYQSHKGLLFFGAVMLLIFLLGCMIESYVNPAIVTKILKKF